MSTNWISWVEFRSSDPKRSAEFYGRVFGWPSTPVADEYVVFTPGQGPGGGFNSAKPQMPPTLVYVHVDSIEATVAQIETAGGEVVIPKFLFSPEAGYISFFKDPDGTIVGLSESYTG